MAANNSVPRFKGASLDELQLTLGVTKFESETDWNQTIGGLIFQGGKVTEAGAVTFSNPFPQQLLYLHCVGGVEVDSESLSGFNSLGTGYWLAIGV